ncbi:MAG: hypothetical protein AAF125_23225, partial [Chloroflexota bacterium]
MALDLTIIGVFIGAALIYAVLPRRWRSWALLVGSLVAIYALQPFLRIRYMDFILPTVTVV